MAFPASKGVLSDVLEKACARALHTKAVAQQVRDQLAVSNVGAGRIIAIDGDLRRVKAEMQRYAATDGIGAYAQEQFNDLLLDVQAEWQAMMDAIDGVTTWIRSNFPTATQGGTSYLAAQTWGTNGPVDREFTPAQTEGLRTQLDALIATIG